MGLSNPGLMDKTIPPNQLYMAPGPPASSKSPCWLVSVVRYCYRRLIAAVVVAVVPSAAAVATTGKMAAPLYITVGPPCAGKTTWVRQMQQTQQQQESSSEGLFTKTGGNNKAATTMMIHDVTIDDQLGVYVPIPTSWFLSRSIGQYNDRRRSDDEDSAHNATAARSFMVHGKSAYDRIQDQVELCTILARLSHQISRDECAAKLLSVNNNNNGNNTAEVSTRGILAAVEEYMESTTTTGSASSDEPTTSRTTTTFQLPETIDLFVVEALFPDRPAGNNNNNNKNHQHHPPASSKSTTGAIAQAGQVLRDQPIADTIVWGNTNCRCTDYRDALQLAEQQGRPVYFVVYQEGDSAEFDCGQDDDEDNNGTTPTTVPTAGNQQQRQYLHAKDLQQLFRRSITRLVQTGRYVPSAVIGDMRRRCLELQIMTDNTTTNHNGTIPSGVALECHLARLAQYELDPKTRLVRALSTKRRLSNDPQQRGGGPSIHHHSPRTVGGQLREPWRGGLLYDANHRYGNYSATNNSAAGGNTSTTRGGGSGRSSGGRGGGGRSLWTAGDRTHEPQQHRGSGGGRWSGR
jgi:hypothetical protein